MFKAKYLLVILLGMLFVQYANAQRSKSVASQDKIKTYVTDKTGTLTSTQLKSLESKLAAFEKETSNQLVVWMEPSLDGNSVEDRSYDLAEQNGIGQKDKNNGVLLYIAKNDRKLRIEVGYGLEGALTDALSSQIIRKEITPQFKKGNFFEGINAGVDAIIQATKGEYTAEEESSDEPLGGICCIPFPVIVFLVIFLFVFIIPIFNRIFRGSKGKNRSSNWWYTGGSGSSWSSGSSSGWSGGGFSGGGGSFGGGGSSGSW
ncbi:MAG: TPM domain-containing protein [Ignavibacteria bacterium]|nr:TPM domain-containing protein [Ignavibacteria bacterium]